MDLQAVVVDALLVDKLDIFAFPVVPAEHLHIVLLNQAGLFENSGGCVCQHLVPETLPFAVRKAIVIQLFLYILEKKYNLKLVKFHFFIVSKSDMNIFIKTCRIITILK